MTFEEFLERCREKDGWQLVEWQGRTLVRRYGDLHDCPLRAVFGDRYAEKAQAAGLPAKRICDAADGFYDSDETVALLGLVKP